MRGVLFKDGEIMAKRLTDKQKKKIIADYVECGSYNAVAKKYRISATTVKNVVKADCEIVGKCEQKKAENMEDVLLFMDSRKDKACLFIEKALNALSSDEKIASAPLSQIATAMGIVIDKFTSPAANIPREDQKDGLTEAIKSSIGEVESEV